MVPLIVPPPFSNIDFSCTQHFATFYVSLYDIYNKYNQTVVSRGGSRAGCAPPPPLLLLEKIRFVGVKS